MIDAVIRWSLQNRLLVLLAALVLSAPPGTFSPDAWDRRSRALLDSNDTELLKPERSGLGRN